MFLFIKTNKSNLLIFYNFVVLAIIPLENLCQIGYNAQVYASNSWRSSQQHIF